MIKKTTFGIALVLIVILFTAGTVTGAHLLKSETDADQNTIDSKNIVISSTVYHDILTSVDFDTVNASGTVTYELRATDDLDDDDTDESALISEAFSINVAPTNLDATETASGFTLVVTVTDFTPVAGLTYTLVVGDQSVAITSGTTWTFTSAFDYNVNHNVALYVSGTATANPGAGVGFTNYVEDTEDGSVFTFTALSVA